MEILVLSIFSFKHSEKQVIRIYYHFKRKRYIDNNV